MGRVPTLVDGDFVLWESNSIMRYLVAKFGNGRFLSADLRERARAERWLDWALTTLNPAITPAFWGLIRSKPEERDSVGIAEAVKKTNHAMTILDRYLSETAYVAGKEFSIGDIPVGILTYRFYSLPIERHRLPHLEAWYKRLGERPVYRRRIMIGLS